ncbi:MAG: ABC transporter ATP-binding protein [Nitrososphaerota archaeon]
MSEMLDIRSLSVKVNGKLILKNINLKIKEGEIHALLGPNASGKSSLAYAIMGLTDYEIANGEILFKGTNITHLPIEERVKLGIALAFQNPPAIKNVKLSLLLKRISKEKPATLPSFLKELSVTPSFLEREINVGFSGGEKKISELLQILCLKPQFVILDEIDSGLDIINLNKLMKIIQERLIDNGVSILAITHRGDILQFLNPDLTHVMLNGEIVCSARDWRKPWETIVRCGYEKCEECKERELLTD